MNERIKKLWDDAALEAGDESNTWDGQVAFMALFAELIIKECLNQCYNRGMNDELYAGQLKAAEYIEQHFGIKE